MATNDPKPIPELTQQDIERFWSYVDVRGTDECWPWKAAVAKGSGYGVFSLGDVSFYAHRIAFHVRYGGNLEHPLVLHHCDNRSCCNNLTHLYSGTHKNNADDREQRGRSHPRFGDDNPSRKHPELLRWSDQHPFRLHPELMSRGERHGSKTKPWRVAKGERHPHSKLKDDDILEIRRLFSSGEHGLGDLAIRFGVTPSNIHCIVSGKTWRHLL